MFQGKEFPRLFLINAGDIGPWVKMSIVRGSAAATVSGHFLVGVQHEGDDYFW